MLVARTTHLKVGLVWRNGVPHSDLATMTEYYVRHGNILTVTMILDDPIYWEEPFIRNATFELDSGTRVLPEPCEPQVEIPRAAGEVPHYLPGANPYLREFADMYNLPLEAARGGAATTYPEYAKRAARHLRAAREVPGVLLRRNGAGDAERQQGLVPSRAGPRLQCAERPRRFGSSELGGLELPKRQIEPAFEIEGRWA